MSKRSIGWLCCASLGLASLDLAGPHDGVLPHVSTPPPRIEVGSAAQPDPPADDPARAEAAAYFHSRPVPLTGPEIDSLSRTIVESARAHGLDPALVIAVIHIESRGDPFAVSPAGAMGIMQVMPATGEELAGQLGIPWLGPQTLFDPAANVQMGVAYLDQLSRRYGSTSTALAAYNWGPGHIDRRLRRGAALPVDYARSVLERL